MTETLFIYLYDALAARIVRDDRIISLQYDAQYVLDDQSAPISLQFPLTTTPYSGKTVEFFLENLLPDRPEVRTQWARDAGLDSIDAFDLLAIYGEDVAGGLEIYPYEKSQQRKTALTPITDASIAARIRQIRNDSTQWNMKDTAGGQFSLGGAQGKFALALVDNQWFEPSGAHPSTHIFKPGVNNFDGSDITEHVMMRVAEQLGLETAQTSIRQFDGEHVLVVERFDREYYGGSLRRIHQEDFAQATGTPVLRKYESDGGPGYKDMLSVITKHVNPEFIQSARRALAHSLVFFWIMGHADAHSKNFSVRILPNNVSLTPLYDLNCSLAFELESTCKALDYTAFDNVALAMSVNKKFKIGDFTLDSLNEINRECELEPNYSAVFAAYVAANIQAILIDVIEELPIEYQQLQAVKNLPYVIFSQTKRVKHLLSPESQE
ncbi:HipA domain-containing protein [Jonesia quinghaiensis]|uniref:HipA domain-containing protein n=1 Tax=Jonesia quinghaiensis TaxID=262806 RepID=UPI000404ED83|nr:HipA domain-containing protein [Jonesia quinghaiensis]